VMEAEAVAEIALAVAVRTERRTSAVLVGRCLPFSYRQPLNGHIINAGEKRRHEKKMRSRKRGRKGKV
jgi:hypothetical protein